MISSLRIFLIWMPILLIAFVTFSTCMGRIAVEKEVQTAERWFPNYSATRFVKNNLLLRKKLTPGVAKEIQANAIAGLKQAPLSDFPFLHMGLANYSLGEGSDNRNLMYETLNRNERNRLALRTLVNIHGVQKNFGEAIKNLDILLKLKGSPSLIDEYQQALLVLSEIPEAMTDIEGYLKTRPIWGRKFLLNRIRKMTELNYLDVAQSIEVFTKEANQDSDNVIHKNYLTGLQRMHKGDAAYEYWYSLIKPPKPSLPYTIFNPKFERRDELPPFNWREVDKPKFFSEIDEDGGLYASFADSSARKLSDQLLRLELGQAYRLEVDAEWTYRRRQGGFSWVLECVGSGAEIAIVAFDEEAKKNFGGRVDFRLPAKGCEAQTLKLIAKPGQYSQRIWSRTNSANIFVVR